MPLPFRTPALFLTLILAGCASNKQPCPPPVAPGLAGAPGVPDWHDVITDVDHVRLRAWRTALLDAIAVARKDGHGAEIDKAGILLDPDIALDGVAMPTGIYDCSVIKLGAKEAGHTTFIHYPVHHCDVHPGEQGLTRFVEQDGLQRPSGRLYPDTPARMVFLGSMILGDETKAISYGRDNDRDMVGSLQRIGANRWRILFPQPSWESQMDVMELTPAK